MIIDENSPLRRLPVLNREQTLFLDGIRYSIEMADLAYCRLKETLYEMSINCGNQLPNKHIHVNIVSSVLDAWSIIDSLDRLRGFLHCAEFVKKDSLPNDDPLKQNFNTVRNLRNSIQHIPGNVDKLISKNQTILGSLSWYTCLDSKEMKGLSCTFAAGTVLQNSALPFVNPAGKNIELPVDIITLSASGYSVCLSELMKYIKLMVMDIEKQLSQQTLGLPKAAADFIVCAHMRLIDEQKKNNKLTF